jgi:hypothetical protein
MRCDNQPIVGRYYLINNYVVIVEKIIKKFLKNKYVQCIVPGPGEYYVNPSCPKYKKSFDTDYWLRNAFACSSDCVYTFKNFFDHEWNTDEQHLTNCKKCGIEIYDFDKDNHSGKYLTCEEYTIKSIIT